MKDDDDMITIATFGDPNEAEVVKNLLVAEGIPAFVTGGESGGLFAGMGGQFGLVRLLVAESNQERALAILDEKHEEEPEEEAEPEPSTSIKTAEWAREPAGKEESRGKAEIQPAPGIRETTGADEVLREPAAAADGKDDEDEDEYRVAWGAEDYAARAWKAAVIGLLVFPPLLHIYSVYCLMRSFSTGEQLSPAGMRKVVWALLFDVVALTLIPFACCGGFIPIWPRLLSPTPPRDRRDPSSVPGNQQVASSLERIVGNAPGSSDLECHPHLRAAHTSRQATRPYETGRRAPLLIDHSPCAEKTCVRLAYATALSGRAGSCRGESFPFHPRVDCFTRIVHRRGINHERKHLDKDILGLGSSCCGCRRLLFKHDCLADFAADPNQTFGNLLLRAPENMRFHRSPHC